MSDALDYPVLVDDIRIRLVGVGGAGCNTVNRLMDAGIYGVQTVAVNTDLQHLDLVRADRKILLGKTVTKLRGAGGDPVRGRLAAEESREEIRRSLEGSDIVFIAAGLGGGTGTGAAPVVAETAKEEGAIVVGVVTLPFVFEGQVRKRLALQGLEELRKYTHTSVVVDNNKLLELYPQHGIKRAFSLADEVISNMIHSITESIAKPGLINIDYADFKTIISRGNLASLGIGRSSSPNKAEEATFIALQSPLLDASYEGLSGAIVHVSGGEDMQLSEAARPAEIISELMGNDGLVIWGARVEDTYTSYMQVSLILTGLSTSEQVLVGEVPTAVQAQETPMADDEVDRLLEQLGIKTVDTPNYH